MVTNHWLEQDRTQSIKGQQCLLINIYGFELVEGDCFFYEFSLLYDLKFSVHHCQERNTSSVFEHALHKVIAR